VSVTHRVVVETNPNPAAAAAADVGEAAGLADALPWPAGRRPDRVTRRRLVDAVRARRGPRTTTLARTPSRRLGRSLTTSTGRVAGSLGASVNAADLRV
jgi:hypothetical protein